MFSAITLDHHSHLTLQNLVVSKCTTCCDIKKLSTLPTQCFATFHVILRTVITSLNSFSQLVLLMKTVVSVMQVLF